MAGSSRASASGNGVQPLGLIMIAAAAAAAAFQPHEMLGLEFQEVTRGPGLLP